MKYRVWMIVMCFVGSVAQAAEPEWIKTSNQHAQVLLDVVARYFPETAAALGVEGYDAEVIDLQPRAPERFEADAEAAAVKLEAARATTSEVRVRQDLDILIGAARDQRTTSELTRRYMLPFFDLPQTLFGSFQNLLDPRIPKERQQHAVRRLQRYVGAEKGYEPVTELARARYEEEARNPQLLGPWLVEAQQYLSNEKRYLDGIEDLFKRSQLRGWQPHMRTLRRQVERYDEWVRASVLPRARPTNRLPPELYADNLKNFGVRMEPQMLIDLATANFVQSRAELQSLARTLSAERKWASADYRDVVRELKKERIPQDQLLDRYTKRLTQLEEIVKRERIVTLPSRKAAIRLATEAEAAATSAPHIDPPRLIGNTGEVAEFVLPVSNPNAKADAEMDDFNYDAIAWTLTAHEARPGHELQFAVMLESGVSVARGVFALNSANIEGWALYAEALMKQYFPTQGQVGVLQMRMMRDARAFLDPMINLGQIEPDAAKRFLMEEVLLSEPMAQQEVDRYTFDSPGQATAYFYGYTRLNALRTKVELALPGRFTAQPYHDFIVRQGALPFDLLERAVLEEFVPSQQAR